MAELRTRATYGQWLNELGLTGEAAEVGVYRGDFAREVLATWQGRSWHAFDFWEQRADYTLLNDWPMDFDQAFREVQQLAREDNRLRIHRGDVLATDPPIEFDAVYLDSDHTFEHVTREMDFFWPRLKPGGILSGHDYRDTWLYGDDINRGVLFGVKTAVDLFAHKVDRVVGYTLEEWPTWYMRKPLATISPSQIKVVSASTPNILWTDLATKNHRDYCEHRGYSYSHTALPPQSAGSAAWSKLELVRESLEANEFVLWIDADALFMRFDLSLERFYDGLTPLIFFKDQLNGLNTGVFFARRCQQSLEFLDRWLSLRDPNLKWWENGALIALDSSSTLPALVLPHRLANSHPHLPHCWGPFDFIAHVTALTPPVRLAVLKDLAARANSPNAKT